MKKKIIWILAQVLVYSIIFTGCSEDGNITKVISEDAITVVNHPVVSKVDGKERCNGSYPEIIFSANDVKTYPKLCDTMNYYNSYWADNIKASVGGYAYSADEANDVYKDELTAEILRMDECLFSALYYEDIYAGEDNANRYVISYNIDVTTGEYVNISTIITDQKEFASVVRKKLDEKYPKYKDDYDNYYSADCTKEDPFVYRAINDNYNWVLTDEGLHIYFNPLEISDNADEMLDIVITEEDAPNLVQASYKTNGKHDISDRLSIKEDSKQEVEAQDYYYDDFSGDYSVVTVSNPTWKRYTSEYCDKPAENHIKLTEQNKEKTDWLDTEAWATKNGFELIKFPYSDDNYRYEAYCGGEYGYEYQSIMIYNSKTNDLIIDYDLSEVCNGPDMEENKYSATNQFINWAQVVDDTLYLAIGHNGYASEEVWSNYMVAIDLNINEIIWRSEPLTSTFSNFKIVDDTIICGYGFTSEPDYLYLLDRFTGEKVDQIKLESAPSQFEIKGDVLYVATYNTAYEFKIVK